MRFDLSFFLFLFFYFALLFCLCFGLWKWNTVLKENQKKISFNHTRYKMRITKFFINIRQETRESENKKENIQNEKRKIEQFIAFLFLHMVDISPAGIILVNVFDICLCMWMTVFFSISRSVALFSFVCAVEVCVC